METKKQCKHCGTPFVGRSPTDVYCCNGCEYVYKLIENEGLDKFYDLKGAVIPPVGNRVFGNQDFDWLTELVDGFHDEDICELEFNLQGISCVGCVWLIEKVFHEKEGALKIAVHPQLGVMKLVWNRARFDVVEFAKEILQFGYVLAPASEIGKKTAQGLGGRIGLTGAFALNAMLFTLPTYFGMSPDFEFAGLFGVLTLLFATLSFVVGGSYFIQRAVVSLRRKVLHIDLPIALGIVGAYVGSLAGFILGVDALMYFDFVSVFIFLMLLGRFVQEAAVLRNRNQLLEMNPGLQSVAVKPEEGSRKEMSVNSLKTGDVFYVKPGKMIPVSSELLSDAASLSLECINGESEAVDEKRHAILTSGAINTGAGDLEMKAREDWGSSLMHQLTQAGEGGVHRHLFLERVLKYYISAVLVTAFVGGLVWLILGDLVSAIQVTLSVLVVSCPCALGVAVPLADEMAASRLRRFGVYIKEASLWDRLKGIKNIVFDKTGTLTMEVPELKNVEVLDALSELDRGVLLQMVRNSLHPKSRSLRENLLTRFSGSENEVLISGKLEEVIGSGVAFVSDKDEWRLGKVSWADGSESTADTVYSKNGVVLISLSFEDALREDARDEIAYLERNGFSISILSGDQKQKVEQMVKTLGLPHHAGVGEMSPQEKADWIHSLEGKSMMIGDGANDSLAFEAAACRGTPVIDKGMLGEKSDFYFLGRGLVGIRELIKTAGLHRIAYRDVFFFSVLYNLVTVGVCLRGSMSPLLAAVLMPLSSLVTIVLAARRLRKS